MMTARSLAALMFQRVMLTLTAEFFGDLVEISNLPTNEGFGSGEAVLLFVGSINQ